MIANQISTVGMMQNSPPPTYLAKRRQSSSRRSATPLMIACSQGLVAEVRNLIPKSNVGQKDRTGKTALHYCTDNRNTQCAEALITADPTLIDIQDDEGYTPLHLSVINGNFQIARILVHKGADCNKVDKEKHSVIHWATVCGEIECLDLLIEAGADAETKDIHGAYPLHYAAQMSGSNSEMGNNAQLGLMVLTKLLQMSLDVNVKDQDGRQPLLWAASAGSSDAILALVKAGANVSSEDKDGLNALHCAASRGHVECLETLICLCGSECDTIDNNGCTPLFYSVTLGHADCTELLLQHGSDPNRQDRKGRTPAHCGASKGQLETLRLLSQHGANMWSRNVKGDVPLHEAVQSGRKDLVKWLLVQRNDLVNLSNNDGRTSLHLAAINANVEICKILMDNKVVVNPIMKNKKGILMTPLDSAVSRGNRSCAKYLQLHGGVPAAKLVEKYGIHGTVGRIFSGKPDLANDLNLSPSTNRSLNSSFDNRSFKNELEKKSEVSTNGSQESLSVKMKSRNVQIEAMEQINMVRDSLASQNIEESEESQFEKLARNGVRKKSFIVIEDDDEQDTNKEENVKNESKDSLSNYNDSEQGGDDKGKKVLPKTLEFETKRFNNTYVKRSKMKDKLRKSKSDSDIKDGDYSNNRTVANNQKNAAKSPGVDADGEEISSNSYRNEARSLSEISHNHGSGNHKDSGYSDDLEERYNSDSTDSSSSSADHSTLRKVRRKRTRCKQSKADVRTHDSVIVGAAQVENAQAPVGNEFSGNDEIILDNGENVFRNKSKMKFHRRLSEDSERSKSHTCLDKPAMKTKRITASTVKSSKVGKKKDRKKRSNESKEKLEKDVGYKDSLRSENLEDLMLQIADEPSLLNDSDKSLTYLTAKYKPNEHKEVNTNLSKSMRKYYQERQVFQKLLEVKRLQIRCGRANEKILVKRLVDEHLSDMNMVGIRPYTGHLTLKSFEKYLYDVLRDFSGSNHGKVPSLKINKNKYQSFMLMNNSEKGGKNPCSCTSGTHKCAHATNAYSSNPDLNSRGNTQRAAMLPKINVGQTKNDRVVSKRKYRLSANQHGAGLSGRTRSIKSSSSKAGEPVTFEIKHGSEKNIFTLPTDEISDRKKWQVTFTIGMDKNGKVEPAKNN